VFLVVYFVITQSGNFWIHPRTSARYILTCKDKVSIKRKICLWGEEYIQHFGQKTGKENPLGRTRNKWDDNIRMDLRVIWWEDVDRMNLAQDRDQGRALVNIAMSLSGNFLTR